MKRYLADADLSGADLSGADYRYSDLMNANLSGADLRGTDLSKADLRFANLQGANLSGADLREAFLLKTNFQGADLSGADLTGADMWLADLTGANLQGANLTYVDLYGAILKNVKLTCTKGIASKLQEMKEAQRILELLNRPGNILDMSDFLHPDEGNGKIIRHLAGWCAPEEPEVENSKVASSLIPTLAYYFCKDEKTAFEALIRVSKGEESIWD